MVHINIPTSGYIPTTDDIPTTDEEAFTDSDMSEPAEEEDDEYDDDNDEYDNDEHDVNEEKEEHSQQPRLKSQLHLSSRYPPDALPANRRIWAAAVAIRENHEASKKVLGQPEYLDIVNKYAPGASQTQIDKLFRMIYEHVSSDKPSSMEDMESYKPGDMSIHEIGVIDSMINSVFGGALKEVKGTDTAEKREQARVMCNMIYVRCYNHIYRDERKYNTRKSGVGMHVHRRYSKRLRHHEESAAPPQAPLQTPPQEPLQAPLQAKEPDIEARRRYSKRLRNEESAAPLQEPPQVKAPNIEDRPRSTEPKATQAKVDTSVMSISDIKRKTAEIKLQNATKAGELVDLKLEIQREKLKAARK